MAASTAGALKAFLEGQGLGISVYRDRAPENVQLGAGTPPSGITYVASYVTVAEAIAVVPDPLEDGAYSTGIETAQVDVWMLWKNMVTGAFAESVTLAQSIVRALQGQTLTTPTLTTPTPVYAVLVRHVGPRLVDEEENLVHVPITVEVVRAL